jgi:hypothetical protein
MNPLPILKRKIAAGLPRGWIVYFQLEGGRLARLVQLNTRLLSWFDWRMAAGSCGG